MVLRLSDEDREFLRTIWKTLMPHQYKNLCERSYRDALAYFASIVFLGFFTMALLYVPQMLFLPTFIENNSEKLTTLSLNLGIETKEPIVFPERSPFIVLDTTGTITNLSRAKVLVTNEKISYSSFSREKSVNLTQLRELSKDQVFLKDTIIFLILLLGPGFFLAGFILTFLKYLLIAVIIAAGGFLLARLFRFHMNIKRCIVMCLYATTLMVLIDLVTTPFGLNAYLLPVRLLGVYINMITLCATITYFLIGIFIHGHFEARY